MLVVVSIPITGNTTKKHDITGWFAWDWKVNILPKIFGQTMFVSEQFQNAVIYAYFYKIRLKIALKNSAGEGIRTPASQRPTGWLVFGTGPVCAYVDLEASAITTPPPRLD
jgi:hypothetical protein